MTYGAHTTATGVERWLEARMPGYRYGPVLVLIAITFVVMAAGPPDWLHAGVDRRVAGPHPHGRAPGVARQPTPVPARRGW